MSLLPFFEWLASTPGSIALHESEYMYPIVESVHVWSLCVFVGFTAMMDLRFLGLTMRRVPVSQVVERLQPVIMAGFAIMVVTGILLVYAIPVRTYQSVWFRGKLILLLLAGLNALAFHVRTYPRVSTWDLAVVLPRPARVAGALSLLLWAGIVVSGRMIAYNWFDCGQPQSAFVMWIAGCTPEKP